MTSLRNRRTGKQNRLVFNSIKIYSVKTETTVQKNGRRKFTVFYDNNHFNILFLRRVVF